MSEKQPEKAEEKTPNGATRRELFQIGNALALPVLLGGVQAKAAGPLKPGPGIYQSIGVEPVINCRGTFTIIGASVELPEVRAAMDAAAQQFVQLDELAEAVGRRLAELTGAEWGIRKPLTLPTGIVRERPLLMCVASLLTTTPPFPSTCPRAQDRSGGAEIRAQRLRSRAEQNQ